MRMNIVYKNEMKLIARSRRVLGTAVLYNVILAGILFLSLNFVKNLSLYQGYAPYSFMLPINIGLMSVTAVMLALLMTPASSSSVAGERERQTLDILLSTRLTPFEIVSGKLFSSASSALLLLISGVPVVAVTLMYGGIGLGEVYQIVLYLAFFIILAASVGVMCSCLLKSTTAATVAAFGILLFFTVGTGLLVVLVSIAVSASGNGGFLTGPLIYTWLLNPAVTYVGVVFRHFRITEFDSALSAMGASPFMVRFWTPFSIILQTAALLIMVTVGVRKIKSR